MENLKDKEGGGTRETPLVGFQKIHEPHPVFVYSLVYFKYMALVSFPGQVKQELRQSQVIPFF